ncbi:MAG TPA: sigma-70 family RNA polymerase sigma factor [bacterium]|nr:sigma-70 family RNA polymerase sigma factor [bacterium]
MEPKDREEDRKDIEAVLAGSAEAFDRLVRRYQRPIYYLSLRMLRQAEDADEVTQKTFVKAYRALAGFRFESSFKTWLCAIAINLCRTELVKAKRNMEELPLNLPDPAFEERQVEEERAFQKAHLEAALADLPPRQKEVVLLRLQQELPFKEIARLLKSTETAVKVNFHHAMKSLRGWIQKKVRNDSM